MAFYVIAQSILQEFFYRFPPVVFSLLYAKSVPRSILPPEFSCTNHHHMLLASICIVSVHTQHIAIHPTSHHPAFISQYIAICEQSRHTGMSPEARPNTSPKFEVFTPCPHHLRPHFQTHPTSLGDPSSRLFRRQVHS
jgi:hypothetical protein